MVTLQFPSHSERIVGQPEVIRFIRHGANQRGPVLEQVRPFPRILGGCNLAVRSVSQRIGLCVANC